MSFGRQEIPTQMVELQNDAPLPAASEAESDPASARKLEAVADDQLILEERKISIDIPITIEGEADGTACKVELATTTKHPEVIHYLPTSTINWTVSMTQWLNWDATKNIRV